MRTNVSMGDLVVAIPLFSCCFFPISSFFIYVHISQLGRVVFLALAYRWGYRCLECMQCSIGVTYFVVVTTSLSFIVSCCVSMHFELELSHGMIPEFL